MTPNELTTSCLLANLQADCKLVQCLRKMLKAWLLYSLTRGRVNVLANKLIVVVCKLAASICFIVYKVSAEVVILTHIIKKKNIYKKKLKSASRKSVGKIVDRKRAKYGASNSSMKELKDEDPLAYRNILKMNLM